MNRQPQMSGFKIQLKVKGAGVSKPTGIKKTGFFANLKNKKQPLAQKKAFNGSDSEGEEDDGKIVSIDSFETGKGASIRGKAIETPKSEPLVIKPSHTSNWKHILQQRREQAAENIARADRRAGIDTDINKPENETNDLTEDDRIRQALITGEKMESNEGLTIKIDQATEESEELSFDVPVEDFGAALLRGMGWKATKRNKPRSDPLANRKQGELLGIGATAVEEELMTKREKVFEVPMIKKMKKEN